MMDKSSRYSLGLGTSLLAVLFVFLTILVPFLFWQQTWFGRVMDDKELKKSLDIGAKPRKIQHALTQLSEKIAASDLSSAAVWFPAVKQLVDHPIPEVRMTVAWLMGQGDGRYNFQEYLVNLLQDAYPLVRRNAALSLVRFQDLTGLKVIRGMLLDHEIAAPSDGRLQYRLDKEDPVRSGAMVARIETDGKEWITVRSIVPGYVKERILQDGQAVLAGQPILLLSPTEEQVWEALRAMYFIGEKKDLEVIKRFLTPNSQLSRRVQEQAFLSINSIKGKITY